jgi:hypothetical protein
VSGDCGSSKSRRRPAGCLGYGVLCAIGLLVATGCGDRVRTTVQPIFLRVVDSESDRPVPNVQVCVKYDYEGNVPPAERDPEPQRAAYTWFCDTANADGEATVRVKWTMLDRSLGSRPPPGRSLVGRAFLARLESGQLHEEHSVVMRPGASARGDHFVLRVVQIQDPRYID